METVELLALPCEARRETCETNEKKQDVVKSFQKREKMRKRKRAEKVGLE